MTKICFLLNSIPDTWVNFFPCPENFNSLLQDELSNSSPHAVQPSLCLPWLCGTSCIRNLPFFPNRPCLILPSCPGLFCFPFFEGLLFSLWLCKVYRHSRQHTRHHLLPWFPQRAFQLYVSHSSSHSTNVDWGSLMYQALCWGRQGPWSCECII